MNGFNTTHSARGSLFSRHGWIRACHRLDERRRRFMHVPWVGGVVLVACVAAAMLLANLPWTAELYEKLLHTDLSLLVRTPDGRIDLAFPRGMNVEKLVNDGLMVIFFFVVGLEIKREMYCGELSSMRKAILPVMAAAGGMLAPALIYLAFNHGTEAVNGWGIPTATDIAFAVGILSIVGDRVPLSLKVFLTALAVVDDLGAILVIALFYGGTIKWWFLAVALLIMAGLYLLNRMGETRIAVFLIPAFVVWGLFYYSGVHATLSGVAMAMIIPMHPRYSRPYFFRQLHNYTRSLELADRGEVRFPNAEQRECLHRMKKLSRDSIGMSYRMEELLNPYVTFFIMPIFALANAGVAIDAEYLDIFHFSPKNGSVGMGVFFGLLVGKPLGIFLASWLSVKSGLAEMPQGATWRVLLAVACLGGIGFTMSIFVDSLAFTHPAFINQGKIAILLGSLASAVLSMLMIHLTARGGSENGNLQRRDV